MEFAYRDGALCAEQVPLEDIARRFGMGPTITSRSLAQVQPASPQQSGQDPKG